MLSRLQLPYVYDQGYVNLRCVWTLGCPVETRPAIEQESLIPGPGKDEQVSDARAGWFYKQAFEEVFPGMPVPDEAGASCCAQFAVSAAKIREPPKHDYGRYRKWVLETNLRDDLSGRIVEYFWHSKSPLCLFIKTSSNRITVIFGKNAVDCPNAKESYCNVYGICDLDCQSEGVCDSQYTLPRYSTLPKGWPDEDWDGAWRDSSVM